MLASSHVLTWNFPAFVTYLTPLNGLYFSPYMSKRFTFKPVSKRMGKERNKLFSWSHQRIQYLFNNEHDTVSRTLTSVPSTIWKQCPFYHSQIIAPGVWFSSDSHVGKEFKDDSTLCVWMMSSLVLEWGWGWSEAVWNRVPSKITAPESLAPYTAWKANGVVALSGEGIWLTLLSNQ